MWYSYLETRAKFRGVSKQLPSSNLMAFMFVHVSPVQNLLCSAIGTDLIFAVLTTATQSSNFICMEMGASLGQLFLSIGFVASKQMSQLRHGNWSINCQILGAARIASLSLMFLFPQYLSVRFFQALQIVVEICTFDNLIAIAVICCLLERPHLSIN